MHTIAAVVLGLFLIAAGISHFVFPAYFRSLVPDRLPRPDLLVAGSGILEMVLGGTVALPATRAAAGWPVTALLSVYLLVWVLRLRAAPRRTADRTSLSATVAGVVVNAGYVAWAAYVALAVR
ncbi:DoxX family protein [Nocardia wallacei]|uniref:DoxX family protein n=1 Tax=Nocardia wallacei TaxID=480035 RepID=UPI002457548D|nr:hypothetical protein [Nocardia wallacei]